MLSFAQLTQSLTEQDRPHRPPGLEGPDGWTVLGTPSEAAGEAGPQRGVNCRDLCVHSVKENGPLSSSLHVSSMSA